MKRPSIPSATYRLQFHQRFYICASARRSCRICTSSGSATFTPRPIFRRRPDSTHGYDICDHNELNPEIGTRAEYDALVAELHEHGMGQIVDFVPNHMGIARAAESMVDGCFGKRPELALRAFFDIDWHPLKQELENKVLLPILGDQYGRVLETGELSLNFEQGAFFLDYFASAAARAAQLRAILQPRIEKLRAALARRFLSRNCKASSPRSSICRARTETEPEKIAERVREKEMIKKRLARLCAGMPAGRRGASTKRWTVCTAQPGDPRSFDALDALINEQPYRLSFWRVAAEEINYRRFFDVNTLAAIRMELPEVFDATHGSFSS